MPDDEPIEPEPPKAEAKELTNGELLILSRLALIERLVAEGMPPIAAVLKLSDGETPEAYAERNRAAMEALQKRIMSPEYLERFEAIQAETDPVKKAAASAELKRENFLKIDMEAVFRTISARNRQMKAEGMLPPDAPG